MRRQAAAFLAVLLLVLSGAPLAAVKTGDAQTDEALSKLVCICGGCPKLALDHCTCGTAEEMAQEALTLSREGKDSDAIVEAFVGKYGQQVLAAPPWGGFDIVLWAGPVVVLILGGIGLFLFLRYRSRRAHEAAAPVPPTHGELDGFDPFA